MDPLRWSRVIRRLTLPAAIVLGLLLYWNYGWLKVPAGMDTMPEQYPPGTLCLIDKRPSQMIAGAVVFVDLAGGGTLLTRVVRVDGDRLVVAHDNPRTSLPSGEELGPLPRAAVRGLVLTGLSPDPDPGGTRGR